MFVSKSKNVRPKKLLSDQMGHDRLNVIGMPANLVSESPPPAAKKEVPIISGASTVAKRIPAQKDKSVTSMVPASVRVRREAAAVARPVGGRAVGSGAGFG